MIKISGEEWVSDATITAARANQKTITVKATAPTTLYDGMHWVDSSTDPPTVKWYDLTSATWYCDVQARAAVLSAGLTVGSSIVSDTQDTDSLGSTSKEWLNIYVGDAGKIYLGLAQDVSLARSALNTLTLTASAGVVCSAGLTVAGAVAGVTTLSMNNQLTNTLTGGTAPFVITSTTVCTNLNADLWDGFHISSAITLTNTTDSSTKDTGALILEGGLGVEKSIVAGGGLTVSSYLINDFYIRSNGEFNAKNSVDADASLYINYDGYNHGTTRFRDLDIRNGKEAQIALFKGSDLSTILAGGLTVGSTTDSSSKDTGAIICEGGVGIEKNCYVGVDLHVLGQVYTPSMAASDDLDDLAVIRNIRTIDGRIDITSLPDRFRSGNSANVGSLLMLCLGAFKQLDARGVLG